MASGTEMMMENLLKIVLKSLNFDPDKTKGEILTWVNWGSQTLRETDKRTQETHRIASENQKLLLLMAEKLGVETSDIFNVVQTIEVKHDAIKH